MSPFATVAANRWQSRASSRFAFHLIERPVSASNLVRKIPANCGRNHLRTNAGKLQNKSILSAVPSAASRFIKTPLPTHRRPPPSPNHPMGSLRHSRPPTSRPIIHRTFPPTGRLICHQSGRGSVIQNGPPFLIPDLRPPPQTGLPPPRRRGLRRGYCRARRAR